MVCRRDGEVPQISKKLHWTKEYRYTKPGRAVRSFSVYIGYCGYCGYSGPRKSSWAAKFKITKPIKMSGDDIDGHRVLKLGE